MSPPIVSVSIDTEEDNWGDYSWEGATVENISALPRLQDLFDKWGAKPTYLVNHAPLVDRRSVAVLGQLADRPDVEIGAHCHPWNTPPHTRVGFEHSMMCNAPEPENREKIATIRDRMEQELGVNPRTFRAGRWGFGPSVARALESIGIMVDCSVSPTYDWSSSGGPDYTGVASAPYRFNSDSPFIPNSEGRMVELPTTIGFFRGEQRQRSVWLNRLRDSSISRTGVVGLLDRSGILARRWLSPEASSADDMIRLSDVWIGRSRLPFLQVTFHSSTLLPGATPFVSDALDLERFLNRLDRVLGHLARLGCEFATLVEAAELLMKDGGELPVAPTA